MRLNGRTALVTGASAGIGRAIAEQLAAAGAHVLVHGRDVERTHDVAAATAGTALLADLAAPEGVDRLVRDALAVHGRVDILVANVGRGWSGPYDEMAVRTIDDLVHLNLLAPLHLVHRLLPPMLERGTGHVAVVGSVAGRTGVAGEAVYAATKAGLDAFAESLRLELHESGVGVSLTVPGVVATGFFEARGRAYDRRFPRPVPPEVVARALVSAVSRDRAETWRPRWLRVVPVVRALAPDSYRRLSTRFGERVSRSEDFQE
jgi:short-subunit dehydrogenase